MTTAAAEAGVSPATATQGVFITGEFISIEPGRKWTGNDGIERSPYNVKLLSGSQLYSIQYRSEADARDAIGHDVMRGDELRLAVYPRARKDLMFWDGKVPR